MIIAQCRVCGNSQSNQKYTAQEMMFELKGYRDTAEKLDLEGQEDQATFYLANTRK